MSDDLALRNQEIEAQQKKVRDLTIAIGDAHKELAAVGEILTKRTAELQQLTTTLVEINPALGVELRKAEYEKIKEEQLERIKMRNNIFLVQCGAIGAIMTHILSPDGRASEYLIIPWVCTMFAWLAYREDLMTEEIKKVIEASYGSILLWDNPETSKKFDKIRSYRKERGKLLESLLFLLPALVSILAIYIHFRPDLASSWPIFTFKAPNGGSIYLVNTLNILSPFLIRRYVKRKWDFEKSGV